MSNGVRKKLQGEEGYTLLEMMLAVGVLAILTSIISVGIAGYMTTAYMSRVNETAKTVFLAAQNYLTNEKQLGNLNDFNQEAENWGQEISRNQLKEIFDAQNQDYNFDDYEEKYSTDSIRYILLKEGKGTTESSNPIYTIVKEYLNDTDLLEHTFLIEYDTKSGVVRSVFYTEKAETFSYSGERDSKENVILRDDKSLRAKRQGYCGVDTSSLVKYNLDLYSPKNIKLVNGERLYVEWSESNYLSQQDIENGYTVNANEAFDNKELREYLAYDVEVYRKTEDGDGERLFTLKDIRKKDNKGKTLADAEEKGSSPFILAYQEKTNTYQLMLDCIHYSILDMFSEQNNSGRLAVEQEVSALDMLYCKISVHLMDNGKYEGESVPVSTNQQSANYAGGAKTFSPTGLDKDKTEVFGNGNLKEDGSSSADGKACSIANARHLNNMRNASNTSCFVQRADIDWAKPESDRSAQALVFEPMRFLSYEGGSGEGDIYRGTFRSEEKGSRTCLISNLKVDGLLSGTPEKNVGMFRQNRGVIQGLYLLKASVQGAYQTGAVAGVNAGIIQEVTLDDCKVEGSFYTGGITGKNLPSGILQKIQCDAAVSGIIKKSVTNSIELPTGETVTYGQYIGGIAGLNQGVADQLWTSLVDASGNAKRSSRTVSGVSCVGGVFGGNSAKDGKVIEGAVNFNKVAVLSGGTGEEKIQDFGGIAGWNGAGSELSDCENRVILFLEENHTDPERVENIGGITGRNQGTLNRCSNELNKEDAITETAKNLIAAAKTGKMPSYSGVNVGGVAGFNEEKGKINRCTSSNVTTGWRVVGGLIGKNEGSFSADSKERTTEGIVAASRDTAGGIAGTNSGFLISGVNNYAHVFARYVSGGITGTNGGSGMYTITGNKGDSAYYTEMEAPKFAQTDSSMELTDCGNYGFVYALEKYSGGIAGINYGTIANAVSIVDIQGDSYLKNLLGKEAYKLLSRADCVGGIAGCNLGTISGKNAGYQTGVCELYGDSFVGGFVGLNQGVLENYPRVKGNIYGTGNGVGGYIGLNLNSQSLKNVVVNEGVTIYGNYFVGGVIGCYVSDGSEEARIQGATSGKESGSIRGTAYVGGIIGYHTISTESLSKFVAQDLEYRVRSAYDTYQKQEPQTGTGNATVFLNCENNSAVEGKRYVGGMIGYNSNASSLLISKCTNYGSIRIQEENNPVSDGYYYIGGITGRNSAGGVIDQCINDGKVQSPSKYLGGVCEVNEGYVQFCSLGKSQDYSEATITGRNSVGGLVGLNSRYVIQCSTSQYTKISGGDNTGGLVGTNDKNGIITGDANKAKIYPDINGDMADAASALCTASGSVKGNNNTGGVAGLNQGQIAQVSVEKAVVSGNEYVGGFIGNNTGILVTEDNKENTNIIAGLTNNAAKVIGVDQVGGIVGRHNATIIEKCVNQGVVEATGTRGYAGGITGSVEQGITIQNCTNYGTVTSNQSQAGGIAGNNKGEIISCKNYGSVTGSLRADNSSAIGGIAGINEKEGIISECTSGSNQNDPEKEKNPNRTIPNVIQGVYLVGGMAGRNEGALVNVSQGKTVDININVAEVKLSKTGSIGGIAGSIKGSSQKELKDYTYTGTIHVSGNASQPQNIGGIIGILESGMTLENCMFAGEITGSGNAKDGGGACGVGGLAGYSDGMIVVSQNEDGYYTSGTPDSSVNGCTNVGGVAGLISGNHKIVLLRTDGVREELSQVPENQDGKTKNDIYYVNQTSVAGFECAGGFYGRIFENKKQGITLSYYQNGLPENTKAGNIMPNSLSGQSTNLPAGIGGVVGSLYQASSGQVTLSHMKNYGKIGSSESYFAKADAVGGIVGRAQNTGKTVLADLENYGDIICGSEEIGGIAGKAIQTDITDCYNYGAIRTESKTTGGIAGYAQNTNITASSEDKVLNKGSITVDGNYSDIGGIVGGINSGTITGVENSGAVTVNGAKNGASFSTVNTGGIAGKVQGTTVLNDGVNRGEIRVYRGFVTGGIVGNVSAASLDMSNCVNQGIVYCEQQDVGGIIGSITGANKLKITNNQNQGDVYAKYRGGGIVGNINTSHGADWQFTDCTNTGDILGVIPKDESNRQISHLGGCIGINQSNAKLKRLKNTGDMIIDKEYANGYNIGIVSDIGGIFGYLRSYGTNTNAITISNCINTGSFELSKAGSSSKFQRLGGIAGSIQYQVVLDSCENRGILDTTSIANQVQDRLGGIAGISYVDTKLQYCVNYGAVLGNTSLADQVGGIAGEAGGLVYSCKTQETKGILSGISGRKNIGGIVGKASGANCKIASIVTTDRTGYDVSFNSFDVAGKENVGGIAGYQQGATIHTVMNTRDADIVLLEKNTSNGRNTKSAGGIAGYALFDGTVPGVIANCYSFGAVHFADADSSCYLGGVVGYRFWKAGSGGKTTAVSIKDSFYLYAEGSYELVDDSRPDNKKDWAVLAVGNEPNGAYGLDKEDQQYGSNKSEELNQEVRFRWSQEAYKKMYRLLHKTGEEDSVPDKENWDKLETVLDNIVNYYDKYKLPIPETGNVVSNQAYSYTLPVLKMPGFCEKLEVSLYNEDATEQQVAEGTGSLLTVSVPVKMDHQLTSVAFDISTIPGYEQYVGKVLQVAVKAYGVGEKLEPSGEIIYTADSDRKVVQKFIVMPVLPKPQVEAVKQDGAVLTFRMTNWAEYQQSAGAIYDSIKNDPVLNSKEIYQMVKNGLENFTITDFYLTKAGENRNQSYKSNWSIGTADIDENGYFQIDYSTSSVFQEQKSNRQYHDWDIQAIAANKDASLDADTVQAQDLYRYVSSEISGLTFRIEASTKLEKPTALQSRYTGSTDWQQDAGTPGFELSFQKSTSPEEAISHYLITVTNPANGRTHTFSYVPQQSGTGDEEEQPLPCVYTLGKDILLGGGENQLALDMNFGSQPLQLNWAVSAQPNDSEAAKFYTASEDAGSNITVLKKAAPVDRIYTTVEDPLTPNKITFHWEDSHWSGSDTYLISYQVKHGDTIIESKEGETADRVQEYLITLPDDNRNYDIRFTVIRQGSVTGSGDAQVVKTLDSDEITYTTHVGEILDPVTNVNAVFDRAEGALIYYKITFDVPGSLTGDNCKGFKIQAISSLSGGGDLTLAELETPLAVTQPVEIGIPASYAGKSFYIHVTSLAANDSYEDSQRALSNSLTIPSNRLSQPENLTAGIKTMVNGSEITSDLGTDSEDNGYEQLELEQAVYTFAWNVTETSSKVKNQKVVILDGSQIVYSTVTSGSTSSLQLTAAEWQDWKNYTGKELKLLVSNQPQNTNQDLPSLEKELIFYMPRIRLNALKPETDGVAVTLEKDGIEEEVIPGTEIEDAQYSKLKYQISWLEPEYQEKQKETQILLYSLKTDAVTGETVKVPVDYEVAETAEDGTITYRPVTGGCSIVYDRTPEDYLKPDLTPKELQQSIYLTGIAVKDAQKELAGKTIYMEVTGWTDEAGYQESRPLVIEIDLPKRK